MEACPKCESRKWMTGLRLNETVSAAVNPYAIRDILVQHVTLKTVNVCADCGHTEFQAICPEGVWEEWQKRNA